MDPRLWNADMDVTINTGLAWVKRTVICRC